MPDGDTTEFEAFAQSIVHSREKARREEVASVEHRAQDQERLRRWRLEHSALPDWFGGPEVLSAEETKARDYNYWHFIDCFIGNSYCGPAGLHLDHIRGSLDRDQSFVSVPCTHEEGLRLIEEFFDDGLACMTGTSKAKKDGTGELQKDTTGQKDEMHEAQKDDIGEAQKDHLQKSKNRLAMCMDRMER